MIEFVKDFFSSKEAFTRIVRGALFGVSSAAATGMGPDGEVNLVASGIAAVAGALAAGEKNPK